MQWKIDYILKTIVLGDSIAQKIAYGNREYLHSYVSGDGIIYFIMKPYYSF